MVIGHMFVAKNNKMNESWILYRMRGRIKNELTYRFTLGPYDTER